MAQDATYSEQRAAAARYLAYTYPPSNPPSISINAIKAIADAAWADAQTGKTVTSVSYEGGSTSSILTGMGPIAIFDACMDVLSSPPYSPPGVTPAISTGARSVFTRFGSQVVQS